MKSDKLFIHCIDQKKLSKKCTLTWLNQYKCKMGTIFMNSESSKPYVLVLNLTDKIDLRTGEKSIALSNLSIYHTWKNIKKNYNNNKFKISSPKWNDNFELSDGSYSISDIRDYFEYILKKHW